MSAPRSDLPAVLLRVLPPLGLCLMVGWQLLPWVTLPPVSLAAQGQFSDDAFFYSVLARNFLDHGFLTLDGVMPTNGVQPLWMAVQIALNAIAPHAGTASWLAWSSYACYLGFAALAVGFVHRARCGPVGWACLAAVVANGAVQQLAVKGLETALTLSCLMLFLMVVDAWEQRRQADLPSGWPWVLALGAAASACFYARLDLFWVPLVLGAWLWWTGRDRRDAVRFGLIVGALVLPYLLYNHYAHGAWIPISGRVKLFYLQQALPTWGAFWRSNEWQGLFTAFPAPLPWASTAPLFLRVVLTLGLLGLFQVLVWHPGTRSAFPNSLRPFGLAVLAHAAFMTLIYREVRPYSAYYFAPELIWAGLVTVVGMDRLTSRFVQDRHRLTTGLRILTAGVCLFILAWQWPAARPEQPYWTSRLAMAREIGDRAFRDGAGVGAFWPGTFAQFSGVRITPLDGVIGSASYFQNYVRTGREMEYGREQGIRYYIAFFPAAPEVVFADPARYAVDWPNAGLKRLYAHRTELEPIARHLSDPGTAAGWYLFERR